MVPAVVVYLLAELQNTLSVIEKSYDNKLILQDFISLLPALEAPLWFILYQSIVTLTLLPRIERMPPLFDLLDCLL